MYWFFHDSKTSNKYPAPFYLVNIYKPKTRQFKKAIYQETVTKYDQKYKSRY